MEPPLLLRYHIGYGERPAGKGELRLEAMRAGLRAEFRVQNQEGNTRWVSEMGPAGDSRRFTEFAGSETVPAFGFKVLPEQGQVRHRHPSARFEYPRDFAPDLRFVGGQIYDAIRNDGVDAGVGHGQMLDFAQAKLDIAQPGLTRV